MRKFTNFCGIFATVFVTTTIILLASCSQDDDYYDNSEMYTLAEEMGTRSGGGDPGGEGDDNTMYQADHVFNNVEFSSDSFPLAPNVRIDVSTQIRCSFNGTMRG